MFIENPIVRVELRNFKAFNRYSLQIRHMNILVGPNNSGKSTILDAFRVLYAGLRRAISRRPEWVLGPDKDMLGYPVVTDGLPLSLENIATDYDTSRPTTAHFYFANRNSLMLFFHPDGIVNLIPTSTKGAVRSPSTFKKEFPIVIGFVPVLGPFEHNEILLDKRTVQRGLFTRRASSHFRNYWYHFPENFCEFSKLIENTWAGMKINPPEMVGINDLAMFCEENRITREVFWSGFGFQVWCQLLTHFLINGDANLLVVDEPDIYLHPNHQRQILHLLRVINPNILLATHSTEMIGEADPSELILVNKAHRKAHRLVNIHEVQTALDMLGSSQNLTLTQLARTGKVLFVEGTDFRIIGRIASIMGLMDVANQLNFTVVPVDGFAQWEKIQALGWGFERTLGQSISMTAVFDKDFRCDEEVSDILKSLQKSLEFSHIHSRKEIENYLLIPDALDRALKRRYKERSKVSG